MQEQQDVDLILSQFLDGELDQQQALSLLKVMKKNSHIEAKFLRYQVIGQVIRTETDICHPVAMVNRVNQAVRQEVIHFHPRKKSFRRYAKITALAATLAGVAVVTPYLVKSHKTIEGRSVQMAEATQPRNNQQSVTLAASHFRKPLSMQFNHTQQQLQDYLYAHSNRVFVASDMAYRPFVQTASLNQGQ
jgi:negative regulator of sigma E activity